VLTEPSDTLLESAHSDPSRNVYYLPQTGEIFESYESVFLHYATSQGHSLIDVSTRAYSARISFYRLKQFQCEVTGKSGLDYFQALESERQEARTLHARFSEPLKGPILRAVQYRLSQLLNSFLFYSHSTPEIVGRLDHLVEAVYDRFKDRYFKGERMF
jgi:hypothetical protein